MILRFPVCVNTQVSAISLAKDIKFAMNVSVYNVYVRHFSDFVCNVQCS